MLRRASRPRPGHPFFGGAPLLIAHRGGARLAPENTMVAFRQAVDEWDADVLEMDVRLTTDGRVVVIHDEMVDRTTNGKGPIRAMTWEAAAELDAGYDFRDLDGKHSLRGKGVRLPLFAEVIDAFPHTRIIVEPKTAEAAAPLDREIRAAQAEHRVLIGAEFEATRVGGAWLPGSLGGLQKTGDPLLDPPPPRPGGALLHARRRRLSSCPSGPDAFTWSRRA